MRKATIKNTIALPIVLTTGLFVTSVEAQKQQPTKLEPVHLSDAPPTTLTTLIKYKAPRPLPHFWDELARCETGGDWQNGGNFAGGLGIAKSTWRGFGGTQFASTPAKATKDEQITVALRIAVEGWQTNEYKTMSDKENGKKFFRNPVGFSGWGALPCAGGTPKLVAHTPETVIVQKFRWGQKGRLVSDLQAILDIKQDGVYGSKTWAAHQRYILKNNLSRDLAPANPKLKRPSRKYKSITKRCVEFEELAYQAGFPRNQISIVSYLMWRESRCIPTAMNKKDPRGGSRGLLQINGAWSKRLIEAGVIQTADDLFEPSKNLNAAFYVWTHSIIHNRYSYGWEPWSIW